MPDFGKEQYFFRNSKSLKNFMIQIYSCSLVNQYLCIVGPPGIGKTVGAMKFSYLRERIFGVKYKSPYYIYTFHQDTKPSDYFGNSTLEKEKLVFKCGALTKAIKEGNVFISDEFNISKENVMKVISPVLEMKFGKNVLIPGIEDKISIDPDFFFIICQNDKGTFGRNDLPEKIKVKVKIIDYPKRVREEIENICEEMHNKLIKETKGKGEAINKLLSKENAKKCGDLMMNLNAIDILTPWSLRDISKLFSRIKKQAENSDNYKNLGMEENILFYILSSTPHDLIDENRLDTIVNLIQKSFGKSVISDEKKEKLKELYKSPASLTKEEEEEQEEEGNKTEKFFIEKGKGEGNIVKIFFCKNENNIWEQLNSLTSVLNALFEILITSDDEPILISGPSSFETYLAKLLFLGKKVEIVSLNSELSISQLIGSITLLNIEKAKYFYLQQIYEILRMNNIGNLMKDLDNFELNKGKI